MTCWGCIQAHQACDFELDGSLITTTTPLPPLSAPQPLWQWQRQPWQRQRRRQRWCWQQHITRYFFFFHLIFSLTSSYSVPKYTFQCIDPSTNLPYSHCVTSQLPHHSNPQPLQALAIGWEVQGGSGWWGGRMWGTSEWWGPKWCVLAWGIFFFFRGDLCATAMSCQGNTYLHLQHISNTSNTSLIPLTHLQCLQYHLCHLESIHTCTTHIALLQILSLTLFHFSVSFTSSFLSSVPLYNTLRCPETFISFHIHSFPHGCPLA
jgi:hypothetical protein